MRNVIIFLAIIPFSLIMSLIEEIKRWSQLSGRKKIKVRSVGNMYYVVTVEISKSKFYYIELHFIIPIDQITINENK